ncbi:hypothetical protein [Kitasatospora sp. NPDC051914]|uniref:hypothetical protein n=1 Tax=Kitasatospora sp. NPDC051914 TaxID=3154945 RepID=UPI00343F2242
MSAPDNAPPEPAVPPAAGDAPAAHAPAEPTAEPAVEAPADQVPDAGQPGTVPEGGTAAATVRRSPRSVALAAAGLFAVTALSATATVAVGRPDDTAQAAAPAATASASASGASASASPSAAAPPTAKPSAAPVPTSTLHGTVDGSTHGGDIRYFLLPLPAGAESYGSPDGAKLSTDEVSEEFSNPSEMPEVLRSYGYKNDAAERRYRTADGTQEVYVRLMRFKSRQMAKEFAAGLTFKHGDTFDIPGDGAAQGIMLKPEQEAWTGEMVGVSFSGDIEYEVTVYVKGTPDKALLVDAMKRQRERLASGG